MLLALSSGVLCTPLVSLFCLALILSLSSAHQRMLFPEHSACKWVEIQEGDQLNDVTGRPGLKEERVLNILRSL